jgi:hypothetical protein
MMSVIYKAYPEARKNVRLQLEKGFGGGIVRELNLEEPFLLQSYTSYKNKTLNS